MFEEGRERELDITLLMLEYRKGDRALSEITVHAREDVFAAVQRFLKRQLSENGVAGPIYAPSAWRRGRCSYWPRGMAGAH